MVLRYCFGMILSVSTLIIGSGAATPVSVVNFCIARPIGNARPGLAEPGRHGKAAMAAGGHRQGAKERGRDWVPASSFASVRKIRRRLLLQRRRPDRLAVGALEIVGPRRLDLLHHRVGQRHVVERASLLLAVLQ